MKIFGIGPVPIFICKGTSGPTAPWLKDFDVFYTDDIVIGVDVMPSCDIDTQCSLYVEQLICDFGHVGLTACEEDQTEGIIGMQVLNIIPEQSGTVGFEVI